MFFIGYGLFELPSNYVIRRVGARWWLSFLIVSWGACVLGMKEEEAAFVLLLTSYRNGFRHPLEYSHSTSRLSWCIRGWCVLISSQ